MEQQEAGATALTNPQNTKNYVNVVSAKRSEVEKVAKTIIITETAVPRTKITNKFETNSLRSAPTKDFSKNIDVKTDVRTLKIKINNVFENKVAKLSANQVARIGAIHQPLCETLTRRLWRKTSVETGAPEVEHRAQTGYQHVALHH